MTKIVALTCYDYLMAKAIGDEVDILLVGDSLGMVVYGDENTKNVTIDEMIRHTQAVLRAEPEALVVADLPYGCGLEEARKLPCKCVKVEGQPELVRELVEDGFKVMGHAGLKPQTAENFKVQSGVLDEALAIQEAGAFSIVLECVSAKEAAEITEALDIPTIGIGAGAGCSGQILVLQDMLGLNKGFKPKFLRTYADLDEVVRGAVRRYRDDVVEGEFPSDAESYSI